MAHAKDLTKAPGAIGLAAITPPTDFRQALTDSTFRELALLNTFTAGTGSEVKTSSCTLALTSHTGDVYVGDYRLGDDDIDLRPATRHEAALSKLDSELFHDFSLEGAARLVAACNQHFREASHLTLNTEQ